MQIRILALVLVIAGLTLGLALAGSSDDARPTYVGADRCKMCHMAQYRTWQATGKDTEAWEQIKGATDIEKCVKCHTTGFGQAGGFTSFADTPKLVGVQCEVCHGPGSAHVALPASERSPELRRSTINKFITDCRTCHNPHITDQAAAARR